MTEEEKQKKKLDCLIKAPEGLLKYCIPGPEFWKMIETEEGRKAFLKQLNQLTP